MAKRWLHSMDVEVGDNGAPLFGVAGCNSFAGSTKTVSAAATPEAIVAESTPCLAVWVGAPCDSDGAPTNTKPVFIGDVDGQNLPLFVDNAEGFIIGIDDASKIFAKVGVNGEKVEYRILS